MMLLLLPAPSPAESLLLTLGSCLSEVRRRPRLSVVSSETLLLPFFGLLGMLSLSFLTDLLRLLAMILGISL